MSKFTSIDNIQIIFRHLNETNQRPICAHLKTLEMYKSYFNFKLMLLLLFL